MGKLNQTPMAGTVAAETECSADGTNCPSHKFAKSIAEGNSGSLIETRWGEYRADSLQRTSHDRCYFNEETVVPATTKTLNGICLHVCIGMCHFCACVSSLTDRTDYHPVMICTCCIYLKTYPIS